VWIATIVSNIGTWMHEVGAGWLMTSLSSSPSMVALVEAADTLPVMLLALPAGAIADIVDRRRLLIAVQVYFLIVVGALALLTALDMTTAWGLLAFTFAVCVGTAIAMPGQTARAAVAATQLSATADGISSGGTSSGTIADHAGNMTALPTPRTKTNPSSIHAVITSSKVRIPSAPATISK